MNVRQAKARQTKWVVLLSALFVLAVLIAAGDDWWARGLLGSMVGVECWVFGVMQERYP